MKNNSESFKQFIANYWNYYIELESEFLSVRKYVDFHKDNFNTYSVEFLKLYQAICSEIDVIGKAMAQEVNPAFKPQDKSCNILKWWYEIQYKYTIPSNNGEISLIDATDCFLDSFDISPWKKFVSETYYDRNGKIRYKSNSTTPKWWNEYNEVKHNRTSKISAESTKINYTKANLKNVCYALTALYFLEIAYMNYLGTQDDLEAFFNDSKIFVKFRNTTTSEILELFA